MKRHLGFGGDLEEATDGKDAAPPLTTNTATCYRQHPHAASPRAEAGPALVFKRNTHLFHAKKTALTPAASGAGARLPRAHPPPEHHGRSRAGARRRMQRKGRRQHEDTKAAGDHPGVNPNLPAAPGLRLSTDSRVAAPSGPSKGLPRPPGASGDGTNPGLYTPPTLLPSPHCSAPRHGDELCLSERPHCLRPPQAGATSSPGPGWPTHPKPGSSPQSRASRPRLVRLVPITAPAIPKQTQAPRPEKPSGARPRGSAPRG